MFFEFTEQLFGSASLSLTKKVKRFTSNKALSWECLKTKGSTVLCILIEMTLSANFVYKYLCTFVYRCVVLSSIRLAQLIVCPLRKYYPFYLVRPYLFKSFEPFSECKIPLHSLLIQRELYTAVYGAISPGWEIFNIFPSGRWRHR